MERRQRVGIFFGLAIVVVLSLALTAWHSIAQTVNPAPVAGGVGRFQIITEPNLVLEGGGGTKLTQAFLLDSETGRVWIWMGRMLGDELTMYWREVAVDGVSSERIQRSYTKPK